MRAPMTNKTVDAGDAMAVAFDDCPEGLFWFDNTLCFMSEYATATESWRGFRQRDAYVVSSGEYFWGGASTAEDRAKLMVRPIAYPEAYLSALPHAGVSEEMVARAIEAMPKDAFFLIYESDMRRIPEAALSSQHAEPVPVARSEDDMPERIWAGDFNASGFGHCVAGPQGGLYAEYVRADLASPAPAGEAAPFSVHQFTGDGPGIRGADNCQICGRWGDQPETEQCRDKLDAGEPVVKALEWVFLPTPPSGEEYAVTPLGTYYIGLGYNRYPLKLRNREIGVFSTQLEAKAAAQADYDTIRSALVPTTSPAKRLLQEAYDIIDDLRGYGEVAQIPIHATQNAGAFMAKVKTILAALRTSAPVGQQAKEAGR